MVYKFPVRGFADIYENCSLIWDQTKDDLWKVLLGGDLRVFMAISKGSLWDYLTISYESILQFSIRTSEDSQ